MVRLRDAVLITASGFMGFEGEQDPRDCVGYVIRGPIVKLGRNYAWIAMTHRIPVRGLWASYDMKLYHDGGKEPFADGINYEEYDFNGDTLFYLIDAINIRKASNFGFDDPPLTPEELLQMDNKLEAAKKLKLRGPRGKIQHVRYVRAHARYRDIQEGIPVPPLAPVAPVVAPVAGNGNNDPAPANVEVVPEIQAPVVENQAPPANNNDNPVPPQGGRRKSRRSKKSKRSKKSRKH